MVAAIGGGMVALLAGIFALMQGISAWEKRAKHKGEMGLGKAELAFRGKQAETVGEAAKMKYKTEKLGKERAWEEMGTLAREKRREGREERGEAREQAGADRQMMMMMAALQALSGGGGAPRDRNAPFSITSLLAR
jgi:hypothetical protein